MGEFVCAVDDCEKEPGCYAVAERYEWLTPDTVRDVVEPRIHCELLDVSTDD